MENTPDFTFAFSWFTITSILLLSFVILSYRKKIQLDQKFATFGEPINVSTASTSMSIGEYKVLTQRRFSDTGGNFQEVVFEKYGEQFRVRDLVTKFQSPDKCLTLSNSLPENIHVQFRVGILIFLNPT